MLSSPQRVDYSTQVDRIFDSPVGKQVPGRKGAKGSDSDTDFQEHEESEEEAPSGEEGDIENLQQLDGSQQQQPFSSVVGSQASPVPVRGEPKLPSTDP